MEQIFRRNNLESKTFGEPIFLEKETFGKQKGFGAMRE